MIPVYKNEKHRKKASLYRPISLTSCVIKTERIVNSRLTCYSESEDMMSEEEAGLKAVQMCGRPGNLPHQGDRECFPESESLPPEQTCRNFWQSLERLASCQTWNFDKDMGLPTRCSGRLYHSLTIIKPESFLTTRKASNSSSNMVSLKGAWFQTLSFIFIDEMLAELPKGIKLDANDLAVWSMEEYGTTATHRMQLAADKLAARAEDWCVSINTEKVLKYSLQSTQQARSRHHHDWGHMSKDWQAIRLGRAFHKCQTWKLHIQKAETKGKPKLAILHKLAATITRH